jgi:hypothetical protein
MKAEQISVFVENKPGRLMAILKALEDCKVSIKGMSVADAADIGIVRLIVSDPVQALKELQERGFTARSDSVLCARIEDVPGGLLHGVAEPIANAGVNLHYFYAYHEPSSGSVFAIIKVEDEERAEEALAAAGKDRWKSR